MQSNYENYITIIYGLITLTYTSHIIKKGQMDFVILATLYLCLAILYYSNTEDTSSLIGSDIVKHFTKSTNEPFGNKKMNRINNILDAQNDTPSERDMSKVISISYVISFLVYIKHCFIHSDFDYFFLYLLLY